MPGPGSGPGFTPAGAQTTADVPIGSVAALREQAQAVREVIATRLRNADERRDRLTTELRANANDRRILQAELRQADKVLRGFEPIKARGRNAAKPAPAEPTP